MSDIALTTQVNALQAKIDSNNSVIAPIRTQADAKRKEERETVLALATNSVREYKAAIAPILPLEKENECLAAALKHLINPRLRVLASYSGSEKMEPGILLKVEYEREKAAMLAYYASYRDLYISEPMLTTAIIDMGYSKKWPGLKGSVPTCNDTLVNAGLIEQHHTESDQHRITARGMELIQAHQGDVEGALTQSEVYLTKLEKPTMLLELSNQALEALEAPSFEHEPNSDVVGILPDGALMGELDSPTQP